MSRMPHCNYNDTDLLAMIGELESQDISWASRYENELIKRLLEGDQIRGSTMPWGKTHDLFRFRPGEVTLWAGMSGHKKSMLSGQVLQHLAQKENVGIMSFEMPYIDTIERLCYQAAGCKPSISFAKRWSWWSDKRIAIYDRLDSVPIEVVLGVCFHMAKVMGCKHVMIDSLTKVAIPSGDKDQEKIFCDRLSATAKALNIHIHLVCHVRKPGQGGEAYIPNIFDVRGAGEITDQADNVLICWQDKKRERLVALKNKNVNITEKDEEYIDNNYDQRLIVAKHRRGKYHGTLGLYFHDDSLQFIAEDRNKPMPFNIEPTTQSTMEV